MVPLSRLYRTAALALVLTTAVQAASPPAVRGASGCVVTPEPQATSIGLRVLKDGGNAVDAAVAVAAALAVTYPRAGNLGGGGFLLYRSEKGEITALDHRETAPAALKPEMFLDEEGRPVPGRSLRGGLAVGVPGSVAGLAEAHRRWGSRPWSSLLAPAIRLASEGFPISAPTARSLERRTEDLAVDRAARAIFTREGEPLAAGDLLVQKDLAETLRRIASGGPDAFYRGAVAEALVRSVRASGGVLSMEDLASYRPMDRNPLVGSYRNHRVICFPPPGSGGVVLLQILGMLERYDLSASGPGSSLTVHRMVEAERRAYADRARWLGDPDFFDVPVRQLLSPAYLKERSSGIADDRATPSKQIRAWQPVVPESPQTLHFSIADRRGGVVSMTTTLNSSYGAAMVAEGTGILLNNEIDDFALAPGVPNQFGLLGGAANAVEGGKRPLSSMTPTIVEGPGEKDGPVLVLGSPGGATIITSVLQVLVNVIDHRIPLQEAVNAPRFHHQWFPDSVQHEVRAFPADVVRALEVRGHTLEAREFPLGNVAAIGRSCDGAWLGAADPRGEGTAEAY
jgi:gamma-glutamyltranspeptidase/glutathione hydrolase